VNNKDSSKGQQRGREIGGNCANDSSAKNVRGRNQLSGEEAFRWEGKSVSKSKYEDGNRGRRETVWEVGKAGLQN